MNRKPKDETTCALHCQTQVIDFWHSCGRRPVSHATCGAQCALFAAHRSRTESQCSWRVLTWIIAFIDALFLCYSALTVPGLATVNLSTLTVFQQVILLVLMVVGNVVGTFYKDA